MTGSLLRPTTARHRLFRSRVAARWFTTTSIVVTLGLGLVVGAVAQAAPSRSSSAQPRSWTIGKTSLTFNKIVCPTRSVCDAIGSNNRVAKSTDAGRHWADPAIRVSLVGTLDISCPSSTSCVATVDAGQLGHAPQPPRFLVTHNGNATWQLVTPPTGIEGLGPIACPDARHCVALATTASNGGEVLNSTDGGLHWSVASQFTQPGFPALFCASESFCLRAIGGYSTNGPIREATSVSKNLGTTFASRSTLAGAEQISAITCANASHCIAVGSTFTQGIPSPGDGAAYVSSNAGRSWTRVSLPKSIATMNSVACVSTTRCIAAGTAFASAAPSSSFGVLLTSSDTGAHWRIATQGKRVPAATVACTPAGRCIAGATNQIATS